MSDVGTMDPGRSTMRLWDLDALLTDHGHTYKPATHHGNLGYHRVVDVRKDGSVWWTGNDGPHYVGDIVVETSRHVGDVVERAPTCATCGQDLPEPIWPHRVVLYAHRSSTRDWRTIDEDPVLQQLSPTAQSKFAFAGYQIALTYDVHEDGTATLISAM